MTLPIAAPVPNLALILERYAPYVAGEWWSAKGYPASIPTLAWTGANGSYGQELSVRSAANNAFTLAVIDSQRIGSAYRGQCARLIAAVARQYVDNPSVGLQTWGQTWQSPLWAAFAGAAAYLAWDQIPNATERDNVRRMLASEADYVTSSRPPLFWKDANGVELRPGDTAAEENSWCATVLWVAAALMPTHPHVPNWQAAAVELNVTAFCAPQDLNNASVSSYINGRGSNVRDDYLVVNHGRIHPDYSTTATQNVFGPVMCALARQVCPSIVWWNYAKVRRALQVAPMDTAGTLAYSPSTPTVAYPVGTPNDWGTRRPAAYAALDGMLPFSLINEMPTGIDVAARFYESIRAADLSSMQARPASAGHPAGSFVASTTEGNYPEENAYAASQVAFLVLARSVLG